LDCANFNFVLPIKRYGVGVALPPHLSPWVDDKEEGYVPKYKEEVERIRNGEMLDDISDDEQVTVVETTDEVRKEEAESSSGEENEAFLTPVLEKELEVEGDDNEDESESSDEEEDDDDEEANHKALKKTVTEVSKNHMLDS
jgi:pescadillo protein